MGLTEKSFLERNEEMGIFKTSNEKYNKSDDLISRAAAVRALASSNGDYLDALERFEGLPAVDTVPVVHARWQGIVPFLDSEECSHCGYIILSDKLETPYCPWCGAKMDGERRDSDG